MTSIGALPSHRGFTVLHGAFSAPGHRSIIGTHAPGFMIFPRGFAPPSLGRKGLTHFSTLADLKQQLSAIAAGRSMHIDGEAFFSANQLNAAFQALDVLSRNKTHRLSISLPSGIHARTDERFISDEGRSVVRFMVPELSMASVALVVKAYHRQRFGGRSFSDESRVDPATEIHLQRSPAAFVLKRGRATMQRFAGPLDTLIALHHHVVSQREKDPAYQLNGEGMRVLADAQTTFYRDHNELAHDLDAWNWIDLNAIDGQGRKATDSSLKRIVDAFKRRTEAARLMFDYAHGHIGTLKKNQTIAMRAVTMTTVHNSIEEAIMLATDGFYALDSDRMRVFGTDLMDIQVLETKYAPDVLSNDRDLHSLSIELAHNLVQEAWMARSIGLLNPQLQIFATRDTGKSGAVKFRVRARQRG